MEEIIIFLFQKMTSSVQDVLPYILCHTATNFLGFSLMESFDYFGIGCNEQVSFLYSISYSSNNVVVEPCHREICIYVG